jgi:cytochrome c553
MMMPVKYAISAFFVLVALAFAACREEDDSENRTLVSRNGGMISHGMSQNCMNCHEQGGEGSGWFTVAGTVYDSAMTTTYANAIIRLYSEVDGGGTLVATVEADAYGNFFTTEAVNFGNGLYPLVAGTTGNTVSMQQATMLGACNSCHGITNVRIWAR